MENQRKGRILLFSAIFPVLLGAALTAAQEVQQYNSESRSPTSANTDVWKACETA